MWHSSGDLALHLGETLVGTLLRRILDHFTLGLIVGRGGESGSSLER